MVRVVWLPEALVQLNAIRGYVQQFDANAASRLAERLVEAGESLAFFPNRGRPAGRLYRELVTVPPYVIRYRVDGEIIYIARLRHGRQRVLHN